MLLYSFALTVGLVVWALFHSVFLLKATGNREEFRQRLGRPPARLKAALQGRRVVWVHAVSVGEVLAASRLVAELETALGDGFQVVISTTTLTGQALAQQRFGMDRVFYFPLDLAFAVRPFLELLKPSAVVLIESEVWPRMMHECRRRGTPVIVVNARVSDRSYRRSRKVRWIWSRVLRKATLWLAQSEEDARRLVEMGAAADAVRVGGNLKFDVRAPKESSVAEWIRQAAAGRPIIVAGSTVARINDKELSEDEIAIQAWKGKVRQEIGAKLVLAPRHPERFGEVEAAAKEFRLVKAGDFAWAEESIQSDSASVIDIVLLNTIGDLAAVYGVADVAFVGGSVVKRGGHNPLEPAQFGVPVVMGPSYENFRDIVGKMVDAEGVRIAQNGTELEDAFEELLTNRDAAHELGQRGRQVFEREQGATGRVVAAVVALVHAGVTV